MMHACAIIRKTYWNLSFMSHEYYMGMLQLVHLSVRFEEVLEVQHVYKHDRVIGCATFWSLSPSSSIVMLKSVLKRLT